MKKYFRKNITKLVLSGFIFGLTSLIACDNSSSNIEASHSESVTDTLAEKQEAPMTPPPDGKSQRISPPDSIKASIGNVNIQIDYNQPAVKNRTVWGELVPFGEVWRTGANEATVFTTDKDIFVEGQTLHAGRYALFTIPKQDEWTIIFSNNPDQWGAFKYSKSEDALRVRVKPKLKTDVTERLTFKVVSEELHLADVILEWEKIQVPIHIREPF